MDQKELQEKIALYYSKLPPNAQQLFSSMNWLETLTNISQKYGLDEKQKETLGTETTLALLGIVHLVEYEETLTNKLGLSTNSAEKMFEEIEESIIKNIRPQLAQAFEANTNEETEKNPENYQAMLYAISKEYKLTVSQMDALEKAVTSFMEGKIEPDNFRRELEKNTALPPETINKLANDINEKIFKKIREDLKKITESPLARTVLASPKENENENGDKEVLDRAGIEVVPPPATAVDVRMEELQGREEMLNRIEKPGAINKIMNDQLRITNEKEEHPILAQKLSASVQIPKI
ncbi:hypothetical protein HYZ82_01235, partial [Candidatus Nomurabacteria bacterium]|nr:hypothetical protein [Candidatus Nomurabacteria bacterium]